MTATKYRMHKTAKKNCTVLQKKINWSIVFFRIYEEINDHNWLIASGWAKLADKNMDVDEINFKMQQLLPGNTMFFKVKDTVLNKK